MDFFERIGAFLRGLYQDERIPQRDRSLVIVMLVLVVSPLDIIPDWIPLLGVIDDLALIALISDYFFRVLDPEIVLGRWPFGMKSYQSFKRFFATLSSPIPKPFRNAIWKYRSSPYRQT